MIIKKNIIKKAPHIEELHFYDLSFFNICFCFGVKISSLMYKISTLASSSAYLSVMLVNQSRERNTPFLFAYFKTCLTSSSVSDVFSYKA